MDAITPTQTPAGARGVNTESNVEAAVNALGSDVFLRLLVTQLQSQDPTNPVQNEDFIAQLAQFTTLEQATNTNDLLEQLIGSNEANAQLGLVNLVGRTIMTEGDTVSLSATNSPFLSYALSEDASEVQIDVLGQNNEVLRRMAPEEFQQAGAHQWQWDGLDEEGERLPEGVYQFRIKAEDSQGGAIPVFTFARERVTNIALGTESPVVVESGKAFTTPDIISIQ